MLHNNRKEDIRLIIKLGYVKEIIEELLYNNYINY